MSRRVDYFDDPAAPAANSLVPGGSALVSDDQGRILLQRRSDSGNWSLPGGTMQLGETLGQARVGSAADPPLAGRRSTPHRIAGWPH